MQWTAALGPAAGAVNALEAGTRRAKTGPGAIRRDVADCPQCGDVTPVPLGPYSVTVDCRGCGAILCLDLDELPSRTCRHFYAIAEPRREPGARGLPRPYVVEVERGSRVAFWPADADGTGQPRDVPAHVVDASAVRDAIIGLAAAHAESSGSVRTAVGNRRSASAPADAVGDGRANPYVDGTSQHGDDSPSPFGIVLAEHAPLLLTAPTPTERALACSAILSAIPGPGGTATARAAEGVPVRLLWQGLADVGLQPFAAGPGLTLRSAFCVLVAPARLLVFQDADAPAPLRAVPLSGAHHFCASPACAGPAHASEADGRFLAASVAGKLPGLGAGASLCGGMGSDANDDLEATTSVVCIHKHPRPGMSASPALPPLCTLQLPSRGRARLCRRAFEVALAEEASSARALVSSRPGRWLVVITGASRGFGRALAIALASDLASASGVRCEKPPVRTDGSPTLLVGAPSSAPDRCSRAQRCTGAHFVLVARDSPDLEDARLEVLATLREGLQSAEGSGTAREPGSDDGPDGVAPPGSGAAASALALWTVEACAVDLADEDQVTRFANHKLGSTLLRRGRPQWAAVYLVNNAMALPPLAPFRELRAGALERVLRLGLMAPAQLCAAVARHAADTGGTCTSIVVHVSSDFALEPAPTWGAYCATKAAADMLHTALGCEDGLGSGTGAVCTLNYAPGPLDTATHATVRESEGCARDLRDHFRSMHARGGLVCPGASARVLTDLLLRGSFESGAHIDFYDCAER